MIFQVRRQEEAWSEGIELDALSHYEAIFVAVRALRLGAGRASVVCASSQGLGLVIVDWMRQDNNVPVCRLWIRPKEPPSASLSSTPTTRKSPP